MLEGFLQKSLKEPKYFNISAIAKEALRFTLIQVCPENGFCSLTLVYPLTTKCEIYAQYALLQFSSYVPV